MVLNMYLCVWLSSGPQGATSAFKPSKGFPALQYLEHVDKGSPAEKANLKRGDFVLEVKRFPYL